MRQVWGDQEQVNWPEKILAQRERIPHPQVIINAKDCTKMNAIIVERGVVPLEKSVVQLYLRAAIPKFRLDVCKMKKSKIPKLCHNLGLDQLLLEKIL